MDSKDLKKRLARFGLAGLLAGAGLVAGVGLMAGSAVAAGSG